MGGCRQRLRLRIAKLYCPGTARRYRNVLSILMVGRVYFEFKERAEQRS
ncbi:hypothetical protein IFR35_14920 [Pseudomonas fluorescens]|nr:hypothetical protein [Pseudomonas fluorescens]MBD8227539.1 hypothetical protein [Pseudomonas fluorescens]MBD8785505.1 hypothetical protein [Pseudomonas fluorescens]MBD8817734.1 hypothetical protein [Pseudomonas fluorescens]